MDTDLGFWRFRLLLAMVIILSGLTAGAGATLAVQPDEILPDAAMEQRARAISAELRCLVCQNQSIDDSNAPLARDLRMIVRERLKAGDNDTQVMAYIVDRYGEFVLLKPTFSWHNLLLWLTPMLGLLGGGMLALRYMQRGNEGHAANSKSQSLSSAEQARLDQLLKDTDA